ncbi:BDNF/NT-3 growth factors receptor-like [Watersipora subatra]|uniref:BDNF/NT-3 growth factors receptor-like n=1 Tax=Watersipora subatra TaxID=2589382 RepID=UPI00355B9182
MIPATLPSGCQLTNGNTLLSCHRSAKFPVLDEQYAAKIVEISITDCSEELESLGYKHFSLYGKLSKLAVTKCGLYSIQEDAFIDNINLKDLDLSNNNLSVIGYQTILNIRNPSSLILVNNPFVCNCSMIWISILLENHIDIVRWDPVCDGDVALKTLSLPHCEAPKADVYNHSATTGLKLGDNVILSCNATGSPQPQVHWDTDKIKSNYSISENPESGEVVIHISNLQREDDGYIYCYGKNAVFRSKKQIIVEINLVPKIEELGYIEAASCMNYIITGTPPFNLSWYHDGSTLSSDGTFWYADETCINSSCKLYKYGQWKGCMKWSAEIIGGLYTLSVTNIFGTDIRRTKVETWSKTAPPLQIFPFIPPTKSDPEVRQIDATQSTWSDKVYVNLVAPVVALISVITILLVVICWRKRVSNSNKRKPGKRNISGGEEELARLTELPNMLDSPHYHLLSKYCSQKLRIISAKDVKFIKELGEGAFGRVYLGSCVGLFAENETTMVAIQTLKTSVTEDALKDLKHEAELMAENLVGEEEVPSRILRTLNDSSSWAATTGELATRSYSSREGRAFQSLCSAA